MISLVPPVRKALSNDYLTHTGTPLIICTMILTPFHTRMGWVALLADDRALIRTTLPQPSRQAAVSLLVSFSGKIPIGENPLTLESRSRLLRYFSGERVALDDLPIDETQGTAFHRALWQFTRAIPYGSTRTYSDLAASAGHPRAARAVGQCMALNPLPIIIPCHRVVGRDGTLRGFGGGLEMKRALLSMEGAL